MSNVVNVEEIFGQNVFTIATMRERLPKSVFKEVINVIENGGELSKESADVVANEMKSWAMERGATHYTHWFQPLTGITAEKHDSFVGSADADGHMLTSFSGKELIKGEPDASSFPSGGLRATFEARGYTTWDITSPAFLKESGAGVTLCIPTAFCSYTGEALDKKTPLLRSMEAVNKQALRIVRLFGNTTAKRVNVSVGPEQEYFLVDWDKSMKREDLIFTGRTLFGAMPPKGQEMEDHYFGAIKPRVAAYMHDLDLELWKLGIPAKTKHNEVAPCQHELAPVFDTTNIAVDHNQLTMEIMKKVAEKHDLVCLLHEKPFAGINGSGKHNNWSMITNTGVNLLDPGKTPADNIQFLIFLAAIIEAVDEYADLLRLSVASAGNDHRLGANEAPPAIISIFLGAELEAVVDSIKNDTFFEKINTTKMNIGTTVIPHFTKDNTDRNRTSPFAFTGNKFEFRSLGSSLSVSGPNVVLNTAVAEVLSRFYEKLKGVSEDEIETKVHDIVKESIIAHERVIFNGNGYTDEWVKEAEKRGLYNLKSTPDALPSFIADKNRRLFEKHGIFTDSEIESRYEILLENYSKTIHIESLTLKDMVLTEFMPAVGEYVDQLTASVTAKTSLDSHLGCKADMKMIRILSDGYDKLFDLTAKLGEDTDKAENMEDSLAQAKFYHDEILKDMEQVRSVADSLEVYLPDGVLPYPKYEDILFYV